MFNFSAAALYTYLSPFPSQALKKQFSSTILIIKYYNLYQPLSLILLLLLVKENLFDWTQDMQPKPDLEAIEVTLGALLTAAASMTTTTTVSDDNKKQQCHSLLDNIPSHQTTVVHQAYDDYDDEADVVMVPNYPDLVPRPNPPPPPLASSTASADLLLLKEASSSTDAITTQPRRRPLKASDPAAPTTTTTPRQTPPTPTTTSTTTAPGPLSETMFLLALLFGTCFLLYIFPAGS